MGENTTARFLTYFPDSPDSEARPLGGCCVGMRHMDFFFSFSSSPLASMRRSIMNMTHFSSRPSSARARNGRLVRHFFAFLRAKKALMAKVKWWSKTRFPSLSHSVWRKKKEREDLVVYGLDVTEVVQGSALTMVGRFGVQNS